VSVLLLTGPPAAGKNTIAELLARRLDHCAVIDADTVRRMVVRPQRAPWEGKEGVLLQQLGIQNACALARNFVADDYDVVIVDIVTTATLDIYRTSLDGVAIHTVQVLPSEEEIAARLLSRPDYLSRGEITAIYDQQSRFADYDDKLDNTAMEPEDAATWLLERWRPTST
jgi:chloramphenicol 3-O-phosphotransferase